jgi:chaperonin GroEL
VVFQPKAHQALQRGIQQIVDALRPTLGPIPRTVAIDHVNKHKDLPEVLDEGGLIARRIIELPDRDEDMGAMLVRSMIVEQYERVGDGTATAAILFEAIFNEGMRYLAAGGNAMQLRRYLEASIPFITKHLEDQAMPLVGRQAIQDMAFSLCHDEDLAAHFAEAFDMVGELGRIEIREGYGRKPHLEYVEGIYYENGLISRAILPDEVNPRADLQDAAIFVCDFSIEDHQELYPVLQTAFHEGIRDLIVLARNLSDKGIAMLSTNNKMNKLNVIAVKVPGLNETDRQAYIDDLAVLTGAIPIVKATGDTLENVSARHFGRVRRAWADLRAFGIIGGGGDPKHIRNHIHRLKDTYRNSSDKAIRELARKRVSMLLGGSVTIWVGGHSEPEITVNKNIANRTLITLRRAIEQGVVHGGGVILLNMSSVFKAQALTAENTDERAAKRILAEAFKIPAHTIYGNAGYDPGEIMAKLSFEDGTAGFDVLKGQVVDMNQSGIRDSLAVLKSAVTNAIRTAALALTIDSLVHAREVQMVKYPDGTTD